MDFFLWLHVSGVSKDNKDVLVLAATNDSWILDRAISRKFEKEIYVSLPHEKSRLKMFKMNLESIRHTITEEDFIELAKRTEEYV